MTKGKMVNIDIDGITHQTDRAILVKIDDDEIWLPKSQVKFTADPKDPELTKIVRVPEWLAQDKGLI